MYLIYIEFFFMDNIRPIGEMPNLRARLNKGRLAQIQHLTEPTPYKPLRAKSIPNPVLEAFQGMHFTQLPIEVQDVLVGASRANVGSDKPLDLDYLMVCYQTLPEFHIANITSLLNCSERQARKYLQAIRIANLFLINLH